ncbi:low affinity immunoglobulin epsilon Fc receptor isoform X1 [Aplysia californica]|uniref:Low affinity immunoglobulin epsilon Fc receptor isoform X1 n=1 Tax=Aplysia californica TaxID=6500 RepID=A0ABM0K9J1_APLCA|nr:low affinity immunoglobulin epsilon Fc receptor isoform X1 [Aplysia californica]XP_012945676.2 low affinity immunoglobulin epsilon Fc receptor isoform X1 [Aplysia californica]
MMDVRGNVPPRPQDGQSIHKYKKLYILTWICVIVTSLLVSSAAVVVIVHTVRADRADVLTAINQVSTNITGQLSAVQEKFDNLEEKVSDDVNKARSSERADVLTAINQVSTNIRAVQQMFDNLEEKVSDDVNKARSLERADVLTAINQVSTNIAGQLSAVQEKFDNLEEKVSKVEDVVMTPRRLKLCSHGNGCELTSRHEAMTHCYKVFEVKTTWADARKRCESIGGFLAEFHDHVSVEYVKRVVAKDNSRLWIGATDHDKEGTWTWVTSGKRLSVDDWVRNQPDNARNSEHCMEIREVLRVFGGKRWNDRTCEHKLEYLCQRDGDNCEDWLEQE